MRIGLRTKRFALSLLYGLLGFGLLVIILGGPGYALGIAAAVLIVAWRHDNNAGTFFPLAILTLIALTALLLIFYLLARLHH